MKYFVFLSDASVQCSAGFSGMEVSHRGSMFLIHENKVKSNTNNFPVLIYENSQVVINLKLFGGNADGLEASQDS